MCAAMMNPERDKQGSREAKALAQDDAAPATSDTHPCFPGLKATPPHTPPHTVAASQAAGGALSPCGTPASHRRVSSCVLVREALVSSIPGPLCCPSQALGSALPIRLLPAHGSPYAQGLVSDPLPITSPMVSWPFNLHFSGRTLRPMYGGTQSQSQVGGDRPLRHGLQSGREHGVGVERLRAPGESSWSLPERWVKVNKAKSYLLGPCSAAKKEGLQP